MNRIDIDRYRKIEHCIDIEKLDVKKKIDCAIEKVRMRER